MLHAATWMDLEILILCEVSQAEKYKYCMLSLISGNLKKRLQMNLFTKQKQSYRCKNINLWLPGSKWGRINLKTGIDTHYSIEWTSLIAQR